MALKNTGKDTASLKAAKPLQKGTGPDIKPEAAKALAGESVGGGKGEGFARALRAHGTGGS